MQRHKKKSWSKKGKEFLVGECLYCFKQIFNTDAFVVFATKKPAHYSCYKNQSDDKTYENEV
tara:strand:+ start:611 stop:796 length:186 start_codon:yes stop_codon:yes gene_type:complete